TASSAPSARPPATQIWRPPSPSSPPARRRPSTIASRARASWPGSRRRAPTPSTWRCTSGSSRGASARGRSAHVAGDEDRRREKDEEPDEELGHERCPRVGLVNARLGLFLLEFLERGQLAIGLHGLGERGVELGSLAGGRCLR